MTPLSDREKLMHQWREYVRKWPEMDALGSADWWLDKMFPVMRNRLTDIDENDIPIGVIRVPPPAKSPSPSGEEHGPHAAMFLKGLVKSAQDIFESVTPEKTALMVNMSAPASPVEDDWQKRMNDTKRILKMAAPGLARPNEPVEEGWVKVFYKKFVVSSQGNIIWDFIENGKHVTHKKLTDFIRSAISRARKEERAPYDELLYAVARKFEGETRHETALRYIREAEQRASSGSLTALTDKLK